jgi:ATP-dependent Lhr-like helicase
VASEVRPDDDAVSSFLPPVAAWFRARFAMATLPQRLGWPVIRSGRNTLIIAPTGSGKTLAAFLACLDALWSERAQRSKGVRVLYVSPLKALNADIARNLERPLGEIVELAREMGMPLAPLTHAVRTGDTPASERQRMLRRPPDLLITTPESLHLLLTSRARETLRSVRYVIVDEIHAVCGSKRGVFLSLLLERLSRIVGEGFTRIGLSATQKPLDEVARFLGGRKRVRGSGADAEYEPRPVVIVDAGRRRELDLEVTLPGGVVGPGGSAWPAIEERIAEQVEAHRSTIVFANNRRVVERMAAALEERAAESVGREPELESEREAGAVSVRPHHGSLSLEARHETEAQLKRGELKAVVATGSLELGIDLDAIDLVCQVESPGAVSTALQRVGRSGHVVGGTSRGRLYAKTRGDLLEVAALARAMLEGEIESLQVPANCLDVLAQQVVACVAVEEWKAQELFDLVRQSYAYRGLTAEVFEGVLSMVSGRFGIETFRDLRPRIGWDRVHNVLRAMPGTAQLALVGGGTIPDTGQYPLYLGDEGPRLGELDEEFVHERRVGEAFRLGQATWRIVSIDTQRVVVAPAEGHSALVPFWRGEGTGRSAELGEAVGRLCREIIERGDVAAARLVEECRLDEPSARILAGYVARQQAIAGAVPDDRTILVESFRDEAGETGVAVLTTLGSKFNHALKLVVLARLRRRFGIEVAGLHADDGVLFRLPGMDEPPLDLLDGLTVEEAEKLLRESLGESPLFGLRFRQNAGRALLMPRPDPGKRTPLWLQRLRARDLLQAVRRFPDFPVVIETYRECLDDDLDLPRMRRVIQAIEQEKMRVVTRKGQNSSPFASELLFQFTQTYMYEWDAPKQGARAGVPRLDESLLESVLKPGEFGIELDRNAVGRLDRRLRGVGRPPRTPEEMAGALVRLGDLYTHELEGPMLGFLEQLEAQGRAVRLAPAEDGGSERWILAEERELYLAALQGEGGVAAEAKRSIVCRYVHTRALVGLEEVVARYHLDPAEATELLEDLVEQGVVERIDDGEGAVEWAERRNLAEARRLTVALRRRESVAVAPEVFARFVLERQRVAPGHVMEGELALTSVLEQFEGYAAPLELWESEILPRRISGFRPAWLDSLLSGGGWAWRAVGHLRGSPILAFLSREAGLSGTSAARIEDAAPLTAGARCVAEILQGRGACHVDEIAGWTRMTPSAVRESLGELLGRGQVTADRLDPLRPNGRETVEHVPAAAARSAAGRRPRLGARPRGLGAVALPRWSAVMLDCEAAAGVLPEELAVEWASRLLGRYGVLCRETCALDPWAPAWRELLDPLARAELRGELRRGYFVEGLSGVQYALPETTDTLASMAGRERPAVTHPLLLASLDPANLYGGGAPFDIPLLEGGTARLNRVPGTYLVMSGGRPVLIVEGSGRRLTGLASASDDELRGAVALLPSLHGPSRRSLRVETYNGAPPASTPAKAWLEEAGFVRDLIGMTHYRGWS